MAARIMLYIALVTIAQSVSVHELSNTVVKTAPC